MSLMSQKHLQDETAAYAWVEVQVWPNGPVCPHCQENQRISKMQGKATRIGLYKCYACRKQFTVKVGTIFEASHVALHLWLQAFYLMVGSKKGISSNQLHRTLGVTLKTAWFMSHRIREAMRAGTLSPPLGGAGSSGIVEADETFIGRKKGVAKPKGGHRHKNAVLSLVERGGKVRSVHVQDVTAKTLLPIVIGHDLGFLGNVLVAERAVEAVKGVVGKRLTYRTTIDREVMDAEAQATD